MRDPHRPSYHFLPPANFTCDAFGLIHWKGRYHLFYQYQPHSTVLTAGVWAHAVSDDLVRWEHLPFALVQRPAGPIAPVAVPAAPWTTTGCRPSSTPVRLPVGRIRHARVSPRARTIWSGGPNTPSNPVIREPPEGLDITGFRDHAVWREGDAWYQLVGCGIHGVGGTLPLYKSSDLIHWDYVGLLLTGDAEQTDAMWECPDFIPLDGRQVLLVSQREGIQVGLLRGLVRRSNLRG